MEGKEGTKELGKPTSPNEEKHSTEIKTTPDSDIGRISSDLLSQDLELQELKKELSQVNESFNTFRNDYSQLLTLYNETNDELQDLLRERSSEKTHVRSIPPDNTAELLTVQEKYRTLEIERDKYREAAQSDNMRLEIEGTLGSIVEEASRRTLDEVERIKSESNKNISMLISECGKHQERVAELEAELEEKNRILEQQSVSRSPDSVEIADKDAVIYKLREHVNKLEEDKTNLTDQLIEVSNTMRASKEHFESKIRSLEFRASSTKEKLNRTLNENKTLLNECKNSETDIETMATEQRVLRNKLTEVQAVLAASEKQNSQQIRELQEEEARKREEIRSEHHKVIQNLRNDVVNKQNDISRLQEQQCHSTYLLSSKESELNSTISSLTKKLRDRTNLHKQALSDLEKLRSQQEADREKSFKTDSRLKAVNMQLACANNQVAMVTENEAKLCSKIKELQLKIDQLEFDMERGKTSPVTGGVLTHSGLGNIMEQPAVPLLSPKKRNKSSRKQDKKDRKEKEQISKIFSSDVIRSTKKERSRKATSTPHLEKSDTTIKFTDSNCHEDISRISEG
ncbi:hypothetical protein ACHWQZ_G001545 [Mnemiopsis leidyi]